MKQWWIDFPWRCVQTNFTEIDTLAFNEDAFVDALKGFSCNAVMLNAAGILASYPTQVEDHRQNPYLADFDLKHLVLRLQQEGIRCIARTDFSKMHESVFDRHPDWAYRDDKGEIINYNGYVHTCVNGGFQQAFEDAVLRELFTLIPFDGLYTNMASFSPMTVDYSYKMHGPCHCDKCRRLFKEQYAIDIPSPLDRSNPKSFLYLRFQQECHSKHKRHIKELLHTIAPQAAFCSEDYLRQESNTECGRALPHWQYSASSLARCIQGSGLGGFATDTDMLGFYHRHVSLTPAQQSLRLYQSLSNFAGLDYYLFGRIDTKNDSCAYESVKSIFSYAKKHKGWFSGVRSLAKVLLVKESFQYPNAEERGFIRVLTESHIPFDEVLLSYLPQKQLGNYSLVVLPDKDRLDDKVMGMLGTFVEQGGTLLCSGKIPTGKDRKPLPCLNIKSMKAPKEELGATLAIKEEERSLFPHMAHRVSVPINGSYQALDFDSPVESYGAVCTCEPFGPPEICYATQPPTMLPGLIATPYGRGKSYILPWYPASGYYKDGFDIWFCYLQDVLSLCGAESPAIDLHPSVEITMGEKEGATIVHLVNGSGHFGNSFFTPVTMYRQSFSLPWGYDNALCENLDEPGKISYAIKEGRLEITLPELKEHACVLIQHR